MLHEVPGVHLMTERRLGKNVICIHATSLSCLPGLLSTQQCKLLLVSLKIVKAEMPACQQQSNIQIIPYSFQEAGRDNVHPPTRTRLIMELVPSLWRFPRGAHHFITCHSFVQFQHCSPEQIPFLPQAPKGKEFPIKST